VEPLGSSSYIWEGRIVIDGMKKGELMRMRLDSTALEYDRCASNHFMLKASDLHAL